MTRTLRIALITLVATYILVVIGAITRSTGSGMGCPDWPLCHGALVPPLGDDSAWIEWTHRTWAALVGILVLALAVVVVRHRRQARSLVVASVGAVALTGFQAYLGKVTVDTGNAGEWVTAHFAAATLLLAVLGFIVVRSRHPDRLPAEGLADGPGPGSARTPDGADTREGDGRRTTLIVAFAAATVYALLLFGSRVTTTGGAALIFLDWPLFDGRLLPEFASDPERAALQMTHWLHRFVAAIVAVIVAAAFVVVWRRSRGGSAADQVLLGLVGTAASLYAVQVIVGALQIFTTLAPWTVALHLALGALIWLLLAAAAFHAFFEARLARAEAPATDGGASSGASGSPRRVSVRERVSAYVALTKPRIIELLLVTTVPAMILAQRGIPRLDLIAWTLVGGSFAAGAANAINCYLDRDIDQLMSRTRRRPLPAHRIEPEDALVFGLVLGVVAFGVLAVFVNLVAAFLTLIAIAFYVVVYTMLLKRSTPQNIVLGGAAGALPPVIGWAAVTGDIGLPSLVLFAIVFYWTPPHFWALSLRLARDYEAARVPMLPVTHGVPETTRQIALYSVLMVALTLIFFAVARLGLVYLAGALLLGGLFLVHALAMWRDRTDRRAMRLYRFSITYLAALFALMVVDVLVFPFG